MVSAPVGREAAWSALLRRLDAGGSSVVLVAGRPGSGRSFLLHRFGEAAGERGYRAIGCADPISVDPTTKLVDLRRVLATILGHPEAAAGAEPVTRAGRVRQAFDTVANRVRDERAIFDLLDGGPTVLAVDGYSPSGTLGGWFAGRLIPHLRRTPDPVMLVVTDRVQALAGLREAADELIELGPLGRAEVGRYLRDLGAGLRSPLSEQEIDAYYAAANDDPSVLGALDTVFSALAGRS